MRTSRSFKVTGDDRAPSVLRHDAEWGRWELTMFERGSAERAE
jgi:hypothetical protein